MKRKTKRLLIEFCVVMTTLVVFLIFIIPKFLDAQSINTPKCIPDPVFRALLEDALGVQPGEIISRRQAAQIIELKLDTDEYFLKQVQLLKKSSQGASFALRVAKLEKTFNDFVIHDLTGIKYFNNLKQLNLKGNWIDHLYLPAMPSLKSLNCLSCLLKKLDISNNPQLEILLCSNNELTSLDISNNPELRHLNCRENQLQKLDLSQNPLIYALECRRNLLKAIDFADNSDLLKLDLSYNQLASIDLKKLASLENLDISHNLFPQIPDISNQKRLKAINLEFNHLKQDSLPQINQLIKRFSETWIILHSNVTYGILFQDQVNGRFIDGVFVEAKPISEK